MKNLGIIIALFFLIILFGCVSGTSTITGKVKPAISSTEVKIYYDLPSQYEIIGEVEATSEIKISMQSTQNRVINELKVQAARIGANGVFLNDTGNVTSTSSVFNAAGFYYSSTIEKITAQGKAIFVIKE